MNKGRVKRILRVAEILRKTTAIMSWRVIQVEKQKAHLIGQGI